MTTTSNPASRDAQTLQTICSHVTSIHTLAVTIHQAARAVDDDVEATRTFELSRAIGEAISRYLSR